MSLTSQHPLVELVESVDAALAAADGVEPVFLAPADKERVLLGLTTAISRLEAERLEVLAVAGDVADEHATRDAATWLAHEARLDRREARSDQRLADHLARRPALAAAARRGAVHVDQVRVIASALRDLPDGVGASVVDAAEAALIAQAGEFAPRELRILGRRVLEVVAPDVAEEHEQRLLEREEREAARTTYLHARGRGDGTTEIRARVADHVAARLFTYLEAYTSPRQAEGATGRPYDQKLGQALGAFLESVDPARLPRHGGDATTVLVTVDLPTLTSGLGTALIGDEPITASQARRLACTAGIIPAVLGGKSQVLDLGRSRRLFSPAQRTALALRFPTCAVEGCDCPADWCEAHHAGDPWSGGGATDLAEGMLLCSWHHHRAHDRRYEMVRRTGGVRLRRRT